jgi:hypothetical protein
MGATSAGEKGTQPSATDAPREQSRLGFLFAPVDVASLVVFRICFALVMLWHVGSYLTKGYIEYSYIAPRFHFTYLGFGWVRTWPDDGMIFHYYAMGVFAVMILVGLCYRLSMVLFFLAFTYTFLLEKTYYQNHYYLICLISFLMIFLPTHRALSLDALLWPDVRSNVAPAWTVWLLRLQIGIPYTYGAIAKLSSDWLHGQPVRSWLSTRADLPLIGPYVGEDWLVYLVAHGGFVLDLIVVPMLLWQRTRVLAYIMTLVFHFTNAMLWDIGIFPWFMIGATTIFFSPGWPRSLWRSSGVPHVKKMDLTPRLSSLQRATVIFWGTYVALQLVIPFRHFLYPGNANWTEEGHLFAWHMMLREKTCGLRFYARDPKTGSNWEVDPLEHLNVRQYSRIGKDADLMLQFSHYLSRQLGTPGEKDIEIHAIDLVSLNVRKPQLLFDPKLNLSAIERSLMPKKWIYPLTEPLRKEMSKVPIGEWNEVIPLEDPIDRSENADPTDAASFGTETLAPPERSSGASGPPSG